MSRAGSVTPPYSERLRRLLPNQVARLNAGQALQVLARTRSDGVVVDNSDPSPAVNCPGGISQRHATGRLGTALWEFFPGHVALLDRDGTVVSVNQAWRQFGLGRGAECTTGVGSDYLAICDRAATQGDSAAAHAADAVRAVLDRTTPTEPLTYACGEKWFSLQVVPVTGVYPGALIIHTDVTEAHLQGVDLLHRAFHDPLTGLPNRALLVDRLTHAVAVAARAPGSLAVLFLDVDRFKAVNDHYGHSVGDQVLCQVAARVHATVRESDTVGRWGGDEFVVIAEKLDTDTTAADLAARVAVAVGEPMVVNGRRLCVRATIGIAHHSAHTDVEELITAADRALYAQRQRHRGPASAHRLPDLRPT